MVKKTVKAAGKIYKVEMAYSGRIPGRPLYEVAGDAKGPGGEHIDIAVAFSAAWGAAHPGSGKTAKQKAASFRRRAERASLRYAEKALKSSQRNMRVIVSADGTSKIERLG